MGVEPIRCCHHGILNPARLPIPSRRHNTYMLAYSDCQVKHCFEFLPFYAHKKDQHKAGLLVRQMGLCSLVIQVCRSAPPSSVGLNHSLLETSLMSLASRSCPFGFESLPFYAHKKDQHKSWSFGAANGTRTHTVSHTALNRARLPFRHCRI